MQFTREDTRIAKSVAIILMLAHHLFAFPERIHAAASILPILADHNIEAAVGSFGKICVACFLMLSGYGTYLSFSGKQNITGGMIKKVSALYRRYWTVFAVFVPIGAFLHIKTIGLDFPSLFYNVTALRPGYNGEWWFITPFIATMLIFPLLLRLIDRPSAQPLTDMLIVVTLAVSVRRILPTVIELRLFTLFRETLYWEILSTTLQLLPIFLTGCLVAKYRLFDRCLQYCNSKVCALPISVIALAGVFLARRNFGGDWDYIYAPIFVLATVIFVRCIPLLPKILTEIGSVSTEIWLVHSFLCYHFCPDFILLPRYSVLVLLWLLLLSYAIGKVLVLCYHHLHAAARAAGRKLGRQHHS